ncbi:MAG: hypothetical protein DIZ80_08295 [endosymbiont of Galathealinum brachiosum]|uniref:SPOR domain-containing protein n=1 Tax=endosymbiont of Galathealinum brachiosum TaxID=2200906 RepID=A0A370DCI3_9GAMM|nr:MAG: hypothetical protein DIZ80_08295 [endosymbiont of Galathealinum brachiosum]
MKIKRINPLFKLLGLVGVAFALNACSSEPAPWTKSESVWDQRRNAEPEAPAAETYKADLEMPADSASEVELSYQTESVESFAPEAAAEPEPVEAVAEAVSEEGSIMDQPASYYTMQLMASVDIDRVIRFAEENHVSTQYIVATERDGVIWHVLLLDIYPDHSSAVAARDEIAPSLKDAPWIRSVGSVQKLVR